MRQLTWKVGSRFRLAQQSPSLREPSSFMPSTLGLNEEWIDDKQNRLSVCFTGHRHMAAADVPIVTQRLDKLLVRCYELGYRDFLCGGALGFDTLAGERVAALRQAYPDTRLIMVIPCSDQSRRWPDYAITRYERLLYQADSIGVLSPAYYDGCMQIRNRYMVDRSDLCLCYLRHAKGGTASTVAYAVKQEIKVLNLAMEDAYAAFLDG